MEPIQSKLTIILQYKNRFDFICRWLKFAHDQNCPFEIIIADGSKTNDLKRYIEKNKFLTQLKFRYFKTQFDKTLDIYYEKIKKALENVKTPYVLLVDDDDFYNFKNIKKCLEKLESDKTIVSCGGQISHFKILDGDLTGKKYVEHLTFKKNFCNSSIIENIKEYFLQPKGIYYFIHKLDDYKAAWLLSQKYKFSPRMLELFVELYIFTSGKVEILPKIFYYRQYDHSNNNTANMSNDFIDELIRFNWHAEINIILDIISKRIAKVERNNNKEIKEQLILYYKKFLTPYIINNLNVEGNSKLAKLARNNMIKKILNEGKLKVYYSFFKMIKSQISLFLYNRKKNKMKNNALIEFLKKV